MALPLVPIALGAAVLYFMSRGSSGYSQAPADGSSPPKKEPAPPAKTWRDMPPALQEQVATALGELNVSPATGEVGEGTITPEAIQLATQTAALCESQGFYDIAKELRRHIEVAARKVPTPPAAKAAAAVAPPGLSELEKEAIARTLMLDRDPKAIRALIERLKKLPASPERDEFVRMAEALVLQLEAAQSTTQTLQQIDQVIKSPGIAEVHQAVQPLPPAVIPTLTPPPPVPIPVVTTPAPPIVVKAPAPLPAPPPTATTAPAVPPPSSWRAILQNGMKGADVGAWQRQLVLDGCAIKVDNAFGPATTTATKSWQKARGLTNDGKVGPATRAKIGTQPLPAAAPPPPPAVLPTPSVPAPVGLTLDKFPDPAPNTRNLKQGDSGADVSSMQNILKAFGYPVGTVDGKFGPNTKTQVLAFQNWGRARYQDSRIIADGVFGPVSRRLVLMRTAEAKAAAAA